MIDGDGETWLRDIFSWSRVAEVMVASESANDRQSDSLESGFENNAYRIVELTKFAVEWKIDDVEVRKVYVRMAASMKCPFWVEK